MKKTALLGGLTPSQFLRHYWHKKPLLIRQAIPDFKPILTRDALFSLAAREDVESRLVTYFRNQWRMQSGPFAQLPSSQKKNWTLLVQGVDLHEDAAYRLLNQFRFIPDARLDDLMISFASDRGGVGPHFDSYDVFLLQASGQRRWRISSQSDLGLVEGVPLKILSNFQPEQEFVLDPGDMLYLPPQYAHDGIAIGESMTYSIGFRAPSYQELGEAFLQFMADTIQVKGRYADPDLTASNRPARIDQGMISRIAEQLSKLRFSETDIAIFVGEYLSEPKPSTFFDRPPQTKSMAQFVQYAGKRGLKLSRKSRMLYRGRHIFINGESFVMRKTDEKLLQSLADARELDGELIRSAASDVLESFHAWYKEGWIEFR